MWQLGFARPAPHQVFSGPIKHTADLAQKYHQYGAAVAIGRLKTGHLTVAQLTDLPRYGFTLIVRLFDDSKAIFIADVKRSLNVNDSIDVIQRFDALVPIRKSEY